MNLSALQHSIFLQSLGWAIANSLWQAAALWILYQLIQFSHKNATSRFRNNLSTGLLFSIFAWFLLTFVNKYLYLQSTAEVITIPHANNEYLSYATSFDWSTAIKKAVSTLPYLSIAYLLLLAMLSIRLIKSYLHIYFIKNHGLKKPPVEWRLFTEKVSLQMGITKKIRLWFSEHVDVPATIGFIKPFILIPIASINQLSPDQLEAIILHELSHIRRNDYLINLFISIVETVLFFNPFIVLLAKIIKRERENCCDDFVIQYQYDRHSYASALLALEQTRNKNIRLSLAATSGKKQLLSRIQRIMEVSNSNNINYGQKLLALLIITGIICSIAWFSPEKKEQGLKTNPIEQTLKKTELQFAKKEKKKNILLTPPAPKLLAIKNITNKIVNALNEGVGRSMEKQLENASVPNVWESNDQDNTSFNNSLNDRLKKELEPPKEQYFFNNKETKSKNGFFLTPKININQPRLLKQFERYDFKTLNEYLDKISSQFSVEHLGKMQAEILKAFDSLNWKQSTEVNQQWNEQQIKKMTDRFRKQDGQKERYSLIVQKKLALESEVRHIDSIVARASAMSNYYYQPQLPETQYGYELYNTPEEPRSVELNNPERAFRLRRNLAPPTNTSNAHVQIHARLKNMKVECKDGIVYFNGKEMTNLTTPIPSFEVNNGIVIVSDGNKILEIHLENQ